MAHKFFIIFLIFITVSVVVESNSSIKSNVKNDKISEFNTKDISKREKRQINYIYYPYPYNGYQSFYVNPNQRPTRQPQRKSTTQRYSIWDISRKRRSVDMASKVDTPKKSNESRKKRQLDDANVDSDYYPYNFLQYFGRRRNYAEARNQPHTMWDLTRK